MNIIGITGQAGSGKDEIAGHLVKKHNFKQLALADHIKRFGANVFGFDVIQLWGPSSARNTFDPSFTKCDIRSSGVKFGPDCSMAAVKRVCDLGWSDAAQRLQDCASDWLKELMPDADNHDELLESLYFWFASLGHHYAELSPRIMLQNLGTEWGREVAGENVWIDYLLRNAELVLEGYPYSQETGISEGKLADEAPEGITVSDVRFANELTRIKEVGGKIIRITRESADKKSKKLGIAGHASEAEQKSFTDDMFDAIIKNDKTLKDLYNTVDVTVMALGEG